MKFARISLTAVVSVWLAGAPAQAQFFFPFFDNRPSQPPQQYEYRREKPRPKPLAKPAKPKPPAVAKPAPGEAAKPASAEPVVEGPPPPYEPQLLRLSEIMGALAYLQSLCAPAAGDEDRPWRESMENLMRAESAGPSRREKLAGAYNQGLRGYQFSYRICTPNARLARKLFLDEGARLAHDVSAQYRAN